MRRMRPRRRALAAALFAFVLVLGPVRPATAEGVEITISCGALGIELTLCRTGAEAWAEATGNTVRVVTTPPATNERLALYQQILAAGGDDIDVYHVDVIWPGTLGDHFIDLAPYMNGAEKDHFRQIVENNTVAGELKAMPWYTDAGLLYYRTDLLAKYGRTPPETWDELAETARIVMEGERAAGNGRMWGFVFQARAYEGLTCNALEWIDSYGGGTIVDADGAITVDNAAAAEALATLAAFVGEIAPEGVLNYAEEEARGVFQSGNAVFMRNWPYAWALGNSAESPVRGRFDVVPLPRGGPDGSRTGTLGGYQLAVSKYSRAPAVAADLVRHLTAREEQKRRAIEGAYNPTIPALYRDPEVLAAVPFLARLKDTILDAVARPSTVTGARYNRVSTAFWNAVHGVLAGRTDPATALSGLERELRAVKRRGW